MRLNLRKTASDWDVTITLPADVSEAVLVELMERITHLGGVVENVTAMDTFVRELSGHTAPDVKVYATWSSDDPDLSVHITDLVEPELSSFLSSRGIQPLIELDLLDPLEPPEPYEPLIEEEE